ncbi:hypothetical protein HM1_3140 [Heliomicrobium modesticaldum Ice1]|uniref:Uncharacterized protein n=1 Tax=Heliobacterium modesticaldum (strain ATCC 51547 / Ice1) TaxID=498761 RepID=B0TIF7_HELMI|nr:hypothetical protein HM1_3140 [Heliomicrobium modesticaldum Ice1]
MRMSSPVNCSNKNPPYRTSGCNAGYLSTPTYMSVDNHPGRDYNQDRSHVQVYAERSG